MNTVSPMPSPRPKTAMPPVTPSCFNCTHWHWQRFDPHTTVWTGQKPDEYTGTCKQASEIRKQRLWPDPQAVIEASWISEAHKAAVAAAQCPLYDPIPTL
jgi:hypothetical protein